MDFEFLRQGVRERGVEGALILWPLPHAEGDKALYEKIGMFVDPELSGNRAASFLVSGVAGSDKYTVVDLNNLPPGVMFYVGMILEGHHAPYVTNFSGQNGAIQESRPEPNVE